MTATLKRILSVLGFPLFLTALVVLGWVFRDELLTVFRDREAVKAWVLGWGGAGFLAFVLLQVLQVVVFIVPGEVVQVAGGWIFGLWQGLGLSLLGIALGSLLNFVAGRTLGKPFVVALFGEEKVDRFAGFAEKGSGAAGFFLLFVIPGIPKDILCYVGGLTRMPFWLFLLISMIGRLPGILGSTWMGAAAGQGDWVLAVSILVFASLLFLLGVLNRDAIVEWIGKRLHRGQE